MEKTINKFTLLSLSFLLTTAYAIAPAIPQMLTVFPEQTEAQVQLLVTVPALSVTIIVLFNDRVTYLFGKKRTVQIGLLLIALFGTLPLYLSNYTLILTSRVLMGVGLSFITPLAVSLMSYFFSGNKKATMMGLRSASESIGQSLLTLLAGYFIIEGGWRYSFLVYLIAIPIFVLVTCFIPKISHQEEHMKNDKVTSKLNMTTLFYALAMFIVVGSYVGVRVRIPLIMEQRRIGSALAASQILSVIPFIGLIVGAFFGRFYLFLKQSLLMAGAVCMALSYVMIGLATTYEAIFIGGIILGIGYPLIISGVFTLVSVFAPDGGEIFSTSIILSGINMGAFLAPYLLQWIGVFSNTASLVTPFYVYALLLIVFGVLSYINTNQRGNKDDTNNIRYRSRNR